LAPFFQLFLGTSSRKAFHKGEETFSTLQALLSCVQRPCGVLIGLFFSKEKRVAPRDGSASPPPTRQMAKGCVSPAAEWPLSFLATRVKKHRVQSFSTLHLNWTWVMSDTRFLTPGRGLGPSEAALFANLRVDSGVSFQGCDQCELRRAIRPELGMEHQDSPGELQKRGELMEVEKSLKDLSR
jgi:hypothetical protein